MNVWVFVFFCYIYECKQIIMQRLIWNTSMQQILSDFVSMAIDDLSKVRSFRNRSRSEGYILYSPTSLKLSEKRDIGVKCCDASMYGGLRTWFPHLGERWGKKFLYFLPGVYSIWYVAKYLPELKDKVRMNQTQNLLIFN